MILRKVEKYLYPLLSRGRFHSDDQIYLYLILATACLFAMLVHVVLLAFHLLSGVMPLVVANFLSLLLFLLASFFIQRGGFLWAGLLITADVLLYSAVSVVYIGGGNGAVFYLLLVLIMQMIVPYGGTQLRGIMVAVCWVEFMAVLYAWSYYTPIHTLGPSAAMTVVNANIGFVGILIEMSIGNAIKKVIAQFNQDRMDELSAQAYTDPLTGLYNRRYAEAIFSKISAGVDLRGWTVAILDVDNFKTINDKFGHNVGDQILKTISDHLQRTLRKTDIVFRWGGEEFLVLLEGADLTIAKSILDKLRRGIAEHETETPQGALAATVTIGAAPFNPKEVTGSIEQCDKKLYEGKKSGKNIVVV